MPIYPEEIYIENWERVKLTADERNALVEAVERGDFDEADRITDKAYERLFSEKSH